MIKENKIDISEVILCDREIDRYEENVIERSRFIDS